MTTPTNNSICPPVLFLVFNRPDTTGRVFEAIRAARPARLYIAADGARPQRVGEQERVYEVRQIATQVDWPCELITLFRDSNLGCKRAVSSAIDWFFEREPEGVILEDDCMPHPDFFAYCAQMLERYRDDNRIGLIAGTALCDLRSRGLAWSDEDYVFTRYPSVWGWATWRRVWKDYDVSISNWPERRRDIAALTHHPRLARINSALFDRVFEGGIDTWDYQVSFMLWSTSRLAIVPRFNLIENLGFGPGATHTTSADHPLAGRATMHTERLAGPLRPPSHVMPNLAYQEYVEHFASRPLFIRLLERLGLYVS